MPTKGRFKSSKTKQDSDSITSNPIFVEQLTLPLFAIAESQTPNKKTTKKYKQTEQVQKVRFRSRRDKIQSCYIPKSAVSDQGIYHTKLGSIHFTEKLPTKIGDCRLVRHLGVTYICVPHDVPRSISKNQGRVVALDPGVRSFMTLFSEASFGWLGQYDIGRIQRLCYYLDDLISRSTKTNAKKRYRMR